MCWASAFYRYGGRLLSFSLACCFDHPESLAPRLTHNRQSMNICGININYQVNDARKMSDCGHLDNSFAYVPYHREQKHWTGKYTGHGCRGEQSYRCFPRQNAIGGRVILAWGRKSKPQFLDIIVIHNINFFKKSILKKKMIHIH